MRKAGDSGVAKDTSSVAQGTWPKAASRASGGLTEWRSVSAVGWMVEQRRRSTYAPGTAVPVSRGSCLLASGKYVSISAEKSVFETQPLPAAGKAYSPRDTANRLC